MAGRFGCYCGGIIYLVEKLDDPPTRAAIEADLIRAGMRLRDFMDPEDDRHNWRDLYVLLGHSQPGSAFYMHEAGEDGRWGLNEHLLAGILDVQNLMFWAKTRDGEKNRNRPRPIPRPGIVDESREIKKIGSKRDAKPANVLARLIGRKV